MSAPAAADPLLEIEGLTVRFPGRRQVLRRSPPVQAVTDVDLVVRRGDTVGLVGESGSGKSTLGRAVVGLVPTTAGQVRFEGTDLATMSAARRRNLRQRMHLVFQDPYSSLDPSQVVVDIVAEPLDIRGRIGRTERLDRVVTALERVGLGAHHLHRYPHEFSGGQRQRIAIARGIVSEPDLIICDEAVSALDVSTQGQVINLLEDLQDELGLTYLFIAHDLSVVRHVSDRIAVMYLGEVVEEGPAARVYDRPAHPYTASLLAAIPRSHPAQPPRPQVVVDGELPSPTDPPPGCRFHTRCPFAMERCRHEPPPTTEVTGGGTASCHLHHDGPVLAGGTVLGLLEDRRPAEAPVAVTTRSTP